MTSIELSDLISLKKLQIKNKIKFIVLENLLSLLDPQYLKEFNKLLILLKKAGHEICLYKGSVPINEVNKIYKVISYMEAYSCYCCLTGLNYGLNVANNNDNYEQTIFKNRSAGFGNEAKKRFIIGTYLSRPEKFINNVHGSYAIKNKIIE
jgi:aspartyl-tRNA(Asn)/glutamyl-tRNA(Gln) amidotransferase subunit A